MNKVSFHYSLFIIHVSYVVEKCIVYFDVTLVYQFIFISQDWRCDVMANGQGRWPAVAVVVIVVLVSSSIIILRRKPIYTLEF